MHLVTRISVLRFLSKTQHLKLFFRLPIVREGTLKSWLTAEYMAKFG